VASNIAKSAAAELAVAAKAGLLTLLTTAFDIGAQTDDQVAQSSLSTDGHQASEMDTLQTSPQRET
jgi:hypothetical protein